MIDWKRPTRPRGDDSYRIQVDDIGELFVSGQLIQKDTDKRVGLFCWEKETGVLATIHRRFPLSAWCAENVPRLGPAENGETIESVSAKFDALRLRQFHSQPSFSLDEVRVLMQAIADRDEVLEDHKRLVREIDVALNGEKGAALQASLVDILAQLTKPSVGPVNKVLFRRLAELGRAVLGLKSHGRYFEKPHTPSSIAGQEHALLLRLVGEADFLIGLYDRVNEHPLTDIIKVRSRPECSLEVCPNPQACAERCQTPKPCGKGNHDVGADGMCRQCGLAGWEY